MHTERYRAQGSFYLFTEFFFFLRILNENVRSLQQYQT